MEREELKEVMKEVFEETRTANIASPEFDEQQAVNSLCAEILSAASRGWYAAKEYTRFKTLRKQFIDLARENLD